MVIMYRIVKATKWVLCFLAVLLWAHPVFAGFGITPPYVRNDRLTAGSVFTQEILLVRGDPVEDLKAEITVNVPGADQWISIDKGSEFLLPAGSQQVPIQVTVRVPANAEYKQYKGSIRIRTMAPNPASGVSIALGAQLDVDLRVVDEIRDFDVKRVQISEVEEARRVLWLEFPGRISFTMGIENTGNAPTAPSRVQLDIYDKRGNVVLESTQNTNSIEQVRPFETRDVTAYLPTRLPPGAYLVKYSIYLYDNEVKRNGELTLSVLPRGTLAGYVGYGFEGLSLRDRLSIIIPLAVVVLLLLVGSLLMYLRGTHGKSSRKQRHSRGASGSGQRQEPPRETPPTGGSPGPREHVVLDLSRRKHL